VDEWSYPMTEEVAHENAQRHRQLSCFVLHLDIKLGYLWPSPMKRNMGPKWRFHKP
jgi:hypothetical protein